MIASYIIGDTCTNYVIEKSGFFDSSWGKTGEKLKKSVKFDVPQFISQYHNVAYMNKAN